MPKVSYYSQKYKVKRKNVSMLQDYEMSGDAGAGTMARPSEEVLRNIMGFARCYQTVDTGEEQVRFFLN